MSVALLKVSGTRDRWEVTHMRSVRRAGFGLAALLLVLSSCSWPQYRGGPTLSGFQPFETSISRANVGSLTTLWTAATGGSIYSSVTVANGSAYVGSDDGTLCVFDASGVVGCSGVPNVCAPRWTAVVPGGPVSLAPAVSGGVVYVSSGDGRLFAFDAAGARNCTGAPKTCSPLWSAVTSERGLSAPTVDNGFVFSGGTERLYAFDAAGTVGCTGAPKSCSPIWTASVSCSILCSPAVSRGVVYANSNDLAKLYAFDAQGMTGCSGTPRVCAPLWSASTGQATASHWPVAISNDTVYVGSATSVLAFDAAGTAGCSGAPKTCTPLWTSTVLIHISSQPAVGNGRVIVAAEGKLYALDAAGTSGCSGTPKVCVPLWTVPNTGAAAPTIANDVVFSAGLGEVNASDATGAFGCSGQPKVCQTGWASPTIEPNTEGVAVVNGTVFVATNDGKVYAFRRG